METDNVFPHQKSQTEGFGVYSDIQVEEDCHLDNEEGEWHDFAARRSCVASKSKEERLSLEHTEQIFTLYCVGMALAALVLCAEVVAKRNGTGRTENNGGMTRATRLGEDFTRVWIQH